MKNIIKSLYEENSKFNKKAVEQARENKGKINDYLLKEIKKINKDIDDKKLEYAPLFLDYALYILAEFKEQRLYPLLMKLLNKPNIDSFNFYEMGIMDKLPNIVVSVFDGNFETMNEVLENKEVDEYTRSRLLASYIYLHDHGMITSEDLEKYLRKLIKLYNYKYDDIYNCIIDTIIHAKLVNMIEDVKIMFSKGAVNLRYRGDYDDFLDDFFDYNQRESVEEITDVVKEMSWWACFNDGHTAFDDKIIDSFNNLMEKQLNEANQINNYGKVGRNDPCPCGSGKKYKKCCIDKINDALPYQKHIDEALNRYPKKNNNKEQIDFYTYFNQEYIEIDKLLYKGLKEKFVPRLIKRDIKAEEKVEYLALNEAFDLIKELLAKKNFKTIEEYDQEVSIHYSLYKFFEKYSRLIIDRIKENKEKYAPKLGELLDVFYQNFNISPDNEVLFLDRKNSYYILSKKNKEGIKFFEDKLATSKKNRYEIYGYLFDEYMCYYDYDQAKDKIETAIANEKDKKLVKELEELKLEFLDEEDCYFTI